MSLVIRLSKVGRKGERRFRIVVSEKRARRDGRAIESLGWWEKGTQKGVKEIDSERFNYWVSKGARPSPTVAKILESK
ncbi:MAG: 30S ribosomal protein S16 [uncultured bacterium]|nr:MAG: 30S ribosomal protein S16 [uncultured bacterium]KKR14560.1 MAG: 30S ribosomal protein S16 [Candidatus Levybacteria bacterium GW2011_GWA1_39_32]KKR50135.1 MAG: 30S ribosomal protein S16 [Candidatus Levybacteria bacterium GW2011_GWC1_40_19]KKR73136.1 MAG: 30S ribosomal protein S16 [Candidatus Levybacteria bacterium GW2011_GWC2_40_7]KKR94982.1 MAG: 30S ribosomal protein S16 [Candidatus Levybacteria bacterium GW2011_GWA2_41_15]KKS00297.1 MAG: 30S ribosomal protein S16 [Candidatus Levybacte